MQWCTKDKIFLMTFAHSNKMKKKIKISYFLSKMFILLKVEIK